MHKKRLKDLREILKKQKLSAFVVPSNDEFQSEYPPSYTRRLEWLTGFSGSYGVAVIEREKAAFFTDGRYMLQASSQIDNEYEIYNISDKKPWEWLIENMNKGRLVLDAKLHTEASVSQYKKCGKISFCVKNLVDIAWKNRPVPLHSGIRSHDIKYAGQTAADKINNAVAKMAEKDVDAVILSLPESVCWLLNIRGHDLPNTPAVLAYAILLQSGEVKLFIDEGRVSDKVKKHLGGKVKIIADQMLEKELKGLKGKRVMVDPASTPQWFFNKLKKSHIVRGEDPCMMPKACKNEVEVKNAKLVHISDGIAVTKFLCWLEQNVNKGGVNELSATDKLLGFRAEGKCFAGVSFDTIAGFGANGAIVHYRSSEKTNKEIKGNGIFLLDSGGQYLGGTTDITRTIAIGKPTEQQKRNYTLVLKGHIALALAVFPAGTSGSQLDALARQYLWQDGLDYDHGTGHGVGSYLGVHEGPQRISKAPNNVALKPGMIISNEPGYYKTGEYGIRIENLVVVVEKKTKGERKLYGFETITKVPLDKKLIDFALLTDVEKKWLDDYHRQVIEELSPGLGEDEREWLEKAGGRY